MIRVRAQYSRKLPAAVCPFAAVSGVIPLNQENGPLCCSALITVTEWYEYARSTVERYQQEQVQTEEDKHQKERQEVRKLIKDELGMLKLMHAEMGKLEFLKFLYETHPPKNPEHKLGEVRFYGNTILCICVCICQQQTAI